MADSIIAGGKGVLELLGKAGTLVIDNTIVGGKGALELLGKAGIPIADANVASGKGTIELLGKAGIPITDANVAAGKGTIALVGYDAIQISSITSGNKGIIGIIGFSATLSNGHIIVGGSGTIELSSTLIIWQTAPNLGEVFGDDQVIIPLVATTNTLVGPFYEIISHISPSWSPALNTWLTLDSTTGILLGLSPDIEITTPYTFTVRANLTQRTFQLTLQPVNTSGQISWTPESLGISNEGDRSEFGIIVQNFDKIEDQAEFIITGLPTGITFTEDGLLIGNLPFHTPAPATQTYNFTATLNYKESIILGPNTFSFDVVDVFTGITTRNYIPALWDSITRNDWINHIQNLTESRTLYRQSDSNWGLQELPAIEFLNGLIDSTSEAVLTALEDRFRKFEIFIGTLKTASTSKYDVLYYELQDNGSSQLDIINPTVGVLPDPIQPVSIENIRQQLTTNIGLSTTEVLPEWQNVYESVLVVGYVLPGEGQDIIDIFDTGFNQEFVGKGIEIDRLYLQKIDGSAWADWSVAGESIIQVLLRGDPRGTTSKISGGVGIIELLGKAATIVVT